MSDKVHPGGTPGTTAITSTAAGGAAGESHPMRKLLAPRDAHAGVDANGAAGLSRGAVSHAPRAPLSGQAAGGSLVRLLDRAQSAQPSGRGLITHLLRQAQPSAGNAAIQRAVRSGQGATRPPPGAVAGALADRSPGQPLDAGTRAAMETGFGRSLTDVRVHTDERAAGLAKGLGADAFTRGQDVYFAQGRYGPQSARGAQLLAHELAHTLQQAQSGTGPGREAQVSEASDPEEKVAARVAEMVVAGKPSSGAPIERSSPAALQRQEDQAPGAEGDVLGSVGATSAALMLPALMLPMPTGVPTTPTGTASTSAPPPAGRSAPAFPFPPAPMPSIPSSVPATVRPSLPAVSPGSATEIVFPTIPIFDAVEEAVPIWEVGKSFRLWTIPVELPPPIFFATVGLDVRLGAVLDLFVRMGPGVIRDIRLSLDPVTSRYSGTGQFYMPIAGGPRLTLTGALVGHADWLGLFEAASIGGGLRAVGQAPAIVAASAGVTLLYDSGTFSFTARPALELGLALIFDLAAFVEAVILTKKVWTKTWSLYHWQTGRAVRIGGAVSLDYIHGRLQPPRLEPSAEQISIDDLLRSLKDPADSGIVVLTPGKVPLRDRLRELLGESGGDPDTIMAVLAEADDAERAAILTDETTMGALKGAIGNELWPTAQRILRKDRSVTVPALDEGAVFLANRHIRLARFQDALYSVVHALELKGQINGDLAEFKYVRETTAGEGLTSTPRPGARASVEIYDPAFVNAPWLFSTVMHEYQHVLQFHEPAASPIWTAPDAVDRREVEAYLWEVEHARQTGVIVSREQMREIGQRLTDHFNALLPASQTIYRRRYDDAMTRVRDAASSRTPINLTYSVEDARRRVEQASKRIADLVRERASAPPADIPRIDADIARIQTSVSEEIVEVVLADNPGIQVEDRTKGIFRVPVVNERGEVVYVYGSIYVLWHLHRLSPSVFLIGGQIRSRPPSVLAPGTIVSDPRLLVGGSGAQSTVQPYPGDLDFAEEIDVQAPTAADAGQAVAQMLVDTVRSSLHSGDIEFIELFVARCQAPCRDNKTWTRDQLLDPANFSALAAFLARIDNGKINTLWRAITVEGRFVELTKVVAVHAIDAATGRDLIVTQPLGSEFQEAYLDTAPPQIEPMALGAYAALMRRLAYEAVGLGNWLKAAKRAFNYLRAIGSLEGMEAVQPIFLTPQAELNQNVAELEEIASALDPTTPTRILTVLMARARLAEASAKIRASLPTLPGKRTPAAIAADIDAVAGAIRGVGGVPIGPVEPDDPRHPPPLQPKLAGAAAEILDIINTSLEARVRPLIRQYVP